MRIAVPLSEEGVARVLDTATRLLVVDLDDGCCQERVEVPTFVRPPKNRAAEFASLGIDVLLCECVSHALASRLRERGIDIESPASVNVDDTISHFFRHRPVFGPRRASFSRTVSPSRPVTVSRMIPLA